MAELKPYSQIPTLASIYRHLKISLPSHIEQELDDFELLVLDEKENHPGPQKFDFKAMLIPLTSGLSGASFYNNHPDSCSGIFGNEKIFVRKKSHFSVTSLLCLRYFVFDQRLREDQSVHPIQSKIEMSMVGISNRIPHFVSHDLKKSNPYLVDYTQNDSFRLEILDFFNHPHTPLELKVYLFEVTKSELRSQGAQTEDTELFLSILNDAERSGLHLDNCPKNLYEKDRLLDHMVYHFFDHQAPRQFQLEQRFFDYYREYSKKKSNPSKISTWIEKHTNQSLNSIGKHIDNNMFLSVVASFTMPNMLNDLMFKQKSEKFNEKKSQFLFSHCGIFTLRDVVVPELLTQLHSLPSHTQSEMIQTATRICNSDVFQYFHQTLGLPFKPEITALIEQQNLQQSILVVSTKPHSKPKNNKI